MAGLQLRTGLSVRAGSYTPLTPASASTPSGATTTIGQQAYGISGSGAASVNRVPGQGSVMVGLIATAILVFLWYTLPE